MIVTKDALLASTVLSNSERRVIEYLSKYDGPFGGKGNGSVTIRPMPKYQLSVLVLSKTLRLSVAATRKALRRLEDDFDLVRASSRRGYYIVPTDRMRLEARQQELERIHNEVIATNIKEAYPALELDSTRSYNGTVTVSLKGLAAALEGYEKKW